MSQTAPAKFWYASKDGVPVKRYNTPGQTVIDLPEGIEAVAVDDRESLSQIEIDQSVLTSDEESHLSIF